MLCALILGVSGANYILTPKDRFLRDFFVTGLFATRVFERNLLWKPPNKYFFNISFLMPDLEYEPRLNG